jgi:S-DNA-T family DNA segregation ATPase FtsK/SpoIIIE
MSALLPPFAEAPHAPAAPSDVEAIATAEPATQRLFNRPPRILRTPPTDEVAIPGPPQQPAARSAPRLLAVIIPIVTALVYFTLAFARSAQGGGLMSTLPIALLSFVSAGAAYWNYRAQRRAQVDAERLYSQSYREALERTRQRLMQLDQQQRACYEENDPDLATLLEIVRGSPAAQNVLRPAERLWERRPHDPDFLHVRVGRGDRPTSLVIKPPAIGTYTRDIEGPLELAAQFGTLRDTPLSLSLTSVGSLGIAGPGGRALDTLRALLWQIAVHHAPGDVRIAAFWESTFDPAWEWLRWMPHTRALDGDQAYRLLARYDRNAEDMGQVLAALLKELKRRSDDEQRGSRFQPHLVVVISFYRRYVEAHPLLAELLRARIAGVSAICLVPAVGDIPGECGAYLDLTSGTPGSATLALAGLGGGRRRLTVDLAGAQPSNELARLLAPVELSDADGAREMPRNVPLLPLLGIADAQAYDPQALWAATPANSWHRVPVGRQSADSMLEIDLNEGAHGVHGMIAGATGAGKSELLLSFLMALAIKHHPDRLNFMLIDFKGGATFRDLERLPHTAGFVTDLSGFLAERALIAMNSELDRRKRQLNAHGVPNIRSYRRAGLDTRGQHMPNLLIAIDEFDEMIRDYPEFQLELIRVAKQGRSLGVHLLFATQQPSLVKEGLLNNLSYWMSLRVNAKEDSKAMIGLPDAAYLGTDTPGRGFLRDKNSGVRMFQSALITAPYQPPAGAGSREVDVTGRQRLISDEQRLVRAIRAHLAQLVADLRGSFGTSRRHAALEHCAEEIGRSCERFLNGRHAAQEARYSVNAALEGFMQLLSGLPHDDGQGEAAAIERRLHEAARNLAHELRGSREQAAEIELIARRMIETFGARYAAAAYPIWSEPLPTMLPLIELLPTAVQHTTEERAVLAEQGDVRNPQPPTRNSAPWLSAPIGALDRPEQARRLPLLYDPMGAGGNLLALGASGSGKTTLLCALALALAAGYAPGDLWLYLVDGAGSGFGLAGHLPHIADVLAPRQHERVERLMDELAGQLEVRRALFQQHGVGSFLQYRERHREQPALPAPPPAILVAIDNIAELTGQNEPALDALKLLMREGRAYGIYFAVTGYGMRDVAPFVPSFETRLALRLNSDDDSTQLIGKDYASRLIRADQPGRAFLRSSPRPIEAQIALPTLRLPAAHSGNIQAGDTEVAYSDVNVELEQAAEQVRRQWQGFCRDNAALLPRSLRLLPALAPLDMLLEDLPPEAAHAVPLGLDGASLRPLLWLPQQTPHLLIAGARSSGRGTLLRALLTSFAQRHSPRELEFVLVDYSLRGLMRFEQSSHTRRFCGLALGKETRDVALIGDREELAAVLQQLLGELAERTRRIRRGEPLELRTIVAINNWDLLTPLDAALTAALGGLEQYARRGADIGLHCVVTGGDFGGAASGLIKTLRAGSLEALMGRPADGSPHAAAIARRFKAVLSGTLPPGRGFLIEAGQPPRVIQFAHAEAGQPPLLPSNL